ARYPHPRGDVWGDEPAPGAEPRGKAHRGYGGGAIEAPVLEPHERLDSDVASKLAAVLAAEYVDGASIRDLADETGFSIGRVRSLLDMAGVSKRRRGQAAAAD